MKFEKILVTGGSGMVGKSLQKIMPNAIYVSSKDYDLTWGGGIQAMIGQIQPDAIVHLAAKVGGITDNINKPAEYFTDNVLMNTMLMEFAYRRGVKRFIGILSTCIYPDVIETYPMMESDLHKGPPTQTNFSYGYAKRCLAVQTEAYNKQYGTKYQYLVPCNLYGEHDKFGDNSHFIAALIKKIYIAKKNGDDKIVLFGDGTPMRQFMHSDDLAYVIKHCLENDIYDHMNVATTENLSIRQMAEIALEACDAKHLTIHFDSSYPNGQMRKDVSIELLQSKIQDFKPLGLYDGIKQVYQFIEKEKIID
jgi:GDP-L-fucose synthase